jgi:hypothetical protein
VDEVTGFLLNASVPFQSLHRLMHTRHPPSAVRTIGQIKTDETHHHRTPRKNNLISGSVTFVLNVVGRLLSREAEVAVTGMFHILPCPRGCSLYI